MKLNELKEEVGTFAGVRFDSDTMKGLQQYQKDNKIPHVVDKGKLHCTLLYSEKPLLNYEAQGKIDPPFVGKFKKFSIFESSSDEKTSNCLVLEFDCPELNKRHEDLMKKHKATFNHDKFKTHVTLSYNVGDLKVGDLPDYKSDLIMNHEYSHPIQDGWAKSNSK